MTTEADPWTWTLGDWRARTASADPTPGGGSVAGAVATLGGSLLQMAIAVTAVRHPSEALDDAAQRAGALAEELAASVAADLAAFAALMAAYRMPRADEAEAERRRGEIHRRSRAAAEAPLSLLERCADGVELAAELLGLVGAGIRSDVHAGAGILRGAYVAAQSTVEINLASLEPAEREAVLERIHSAAARLDSAAERLGSPR